MRTPPKPHHCGRSDSAEDGRLAAQSCQNAGLLDGDHVIIPGSIRAHIPPDPPLKRWSEARFNLDDGVLCPSFNRILARWLAGSLALALAVRGDAAVVGSEGCSDGGGSLDLSRSESCCDRLPASRRDWASDRAVPRPRMSLRVGEVAVPEVLRAMRLRHGNSGLRPEGSATLFVS